MQHHAVNPLSGAPACSGSPSSEHTFGEVSIFHLSWQREKQIPAGSPLLNPCPPHVRGTAQCWILLPSGGFSAHLAVLLDVSNSIFSLGFVQGPRGCWWDRLTWLAGLGEMDFGEVVRDSASSLGGIIWFLRELKAARMPQHQDWSWLCFGSAVQEGFKNQFWQWNYPHLVQYCEILIFYGWRNKSDYELDLVKMSFLKVILQMELEGWECYILLIKLFPG